MIMGQNREQYRENTDTIMNETMKRSKAVKWSSVAGILAIIWMCVIFSFSAQTKEESSVVSEGFSYRMVSTTGLLFHLHIDEEQIREIAGAIERAVRKSAHMTEFAILAWLLYGWLCRWQIARLRRACAAAAMAVLYACSDEFHQLFVRGRSGKVSDVLIDSAGAVLGMAVLLLLLKLAERLRRRRGRNARTDGV